jgi:hypothetical protein
LPNPFEQLGGGKGKAKDFEMVEGHFACRRCGLVVTEAPYYRSVKQLVWACPDGHDNTYRIDLD